MKDDGNEHIRRASATLRKWRISSRLNDSDAYSVLLGGATAIYCRGATQTREQFLEDAAAIYDQTMEQRRMSTS